MHMEHCKPVLDAVDLRLGQHVLMASGKAAKVKTIKASTILFQYLESGKPGDYIEIPRHRVPELVRV